MFFDVGFGCLGFLNTHYTINYLSAGVFYLRNSTEPWWSKDTPEGLQPYSVHFQTVQMNKVPKQTSKQITAAFFSVFKSGIP